MQHPMKNLIDLPSSLVREHTKKEVCVSQANVRLRDTDLIHKAYHALARTLVSNKTENAENEDLDMLDSEQGIDFDIMDGLKFYWSWVG